MDRPNPPAEIPPMAMDELLPGADFADAWRLEDIPAAPALAVAQRAFAHAPRWVDLLMVVRTLAVAPFGLKTGHQTGGTRRIGMFPVLSQTDARIIMGMDDKHLDFRLVVDVEPTVDNLAAATATTLVRTHNLGGRLYLRLIMPFHRIIVPAMLARAGG